MVEPGGAIPGQARIPLHVGIPGEAFTLPIEGQVEGIAKASCEHFPTAVVGSRGVGIEPQDGANAIILPEVVGARQEPVFARVAVGRRGRWMGWHLHVVANHEKEFAGGPRHDLVHPVPVAAAVG